MAILTAFPIGIDPTPQKNPLFSKLRHFQENPRPDFESPECPLSNEYRFVGVIASRLKAGSHFFRFVGFHFEK